MASSSSSPIDSSGLIFRNYDSTRATRDAARADHGFFRVDFRVLIDDLSELLELPVFPEVYKETVLIPFIKFLQTTGSTEFLRLFQTPNSGLRPEEISIKELIRDMAEALLQRDYTKYPREEFDQLVAFQAIVSDIHKTSDLPEDQNIPPLAVWTKSRGSSPHAIPLSVTRKIDVKAGIVCLHPDYRNAGILAWSSIGHEVGGHHFLGGYRGLIAEFKEIVKKSIIENPELIERYRGQEHHIEIMSTYLSERINEFAADVLGVLNMGPSSAIGFIGYIRGVKGGILENQGPLKPRETKVLKLTWPCGELEIDPLQKPLPGLAKSGVLGKVKGTQGEIQYHKEVTPGDPHPVGVLRPYAMLGVIHLLAIDQRIKDAWDHLIRFEMEKELRDVTEIKLLKYNSDLDDSSATVSEGMCESIPIQLAIDITQYAAKVIAETPMKCLRSKSLKSIVSWNEEDEGFMSLIKKVIGRDESSFFTKHRGLGSRHIVAAAVLESMEVDSDIAKVFAKMKRFLVEDSQRIKDE